MFILNIFRKYVVLPILLMQCSFLQSQPRCIFIEGLVGAGKTTFITMLKKHCPESDCFYEPLQKWLDVQGHGSLWNLYLTEATRWAFTTQIYISTVRMQDLEQKLAQSTKTICFMERSVYGDRYVFAKNLFDTQGMTLLEWVMYKEWFTWFLDHCYIKPDAFIYLHTTPEVTLARMKERQRVEEKDFPLDLQKQFYQGYKDFLINKKELPAVVASVPVLILDADQNFRDDVRVQKKFVEQIRGFVRQLQ